MAADKWQLAAMYNLAVTDSNFRNALANAASPSALQTSIQTGGWAPLFPAGTAPLLSTAQLAAAQGSPDSDEINRVAGGAAIVEGGTDAWAVDYVAARTVRNTIIAAGTTNPDESNQAPLL